MPEMHQNNLYLFYSLDFNKKMYLYLTCKRLVLVLVYITSNLRSHIVRLACKNVTKFKKINFIGQHIVPKSYP